MRTKLSNRELYTPSTKSFCQLVELCFKSTFFLQYGKFWKQKIGAAVDSSLSLIVAKIFKESFEQEAFQLAKNDPKLLVHYVADTSAIFQHGPDKLELFQMQLNSLRDPINSHRDKWSVTLPRCLSDQRWQETNDFHFHEKNSHPSLFPL